jgi:hypothetical protein
MPRPALPHTQRFRKWGHAVGLLLLAGYLIFCHGCHGEDVDDELCVPLPAARDGERLSPRSQALPGNEDSSFSAALPSAMLWRRD